MLKSPHVFRVKTDSNSYPFHIKTKKAMRPEKFPQHCLFGLYLVFSVCSIRQWHPWNCFSPSEYEFPFDTQTDFSCTIFEKLLHNSCFPKILPSGQSPLSYYLYFLETKYFD